MSGRGFQPRAGLDAFNRGAVVIETDDDPVLAALEGQYVYAGFSKRGADFVERLVLELRQRPIEFAQRPAIASPRGVLRKSDDSDNSAAGPNMFLIRPVESATSTIAPIEGNKFRRHLHLRDRVQERGVGFASRRMEERRR